MCEGMLPSGTSGTSQSCISHSPAACQIQPRSYSITMPTKFCPTLPSCASLPGARHAPTPALSAAATCRSFLGPRCRPRAASGRPLAWAEVRRRKGCPRLAWTGALTLDRTADPHPAVPCQPQQVLLPTQLLEAPAATRLDSGSAHAASGLSTSSLGCCSSCRPDQGTAAAHEVHAKP